MYDWSVPGALEAADLVHRSVGARVAIFIGTEDPAADELIRRGVPYEDEAARYVRQLRLLGVEAIDLISRSVMGTEDEGPVLADWCDRQGFRSVIVVSTGVTRDASSKRFTVPKEVITREP